MTVAPETINVDRPTPTLAQVGHEGNPVLFDLVVIGVLDSPNPFTPGPDGPGDLGGPVLYPPTGSGGSGGGGGQAPINDLTGGGGTINCLTGDSTVPIFVNGGVGPYTWSTTLGSLGASTTSTGSNTLGPSTNTGSSVSGTAAGKCVKYCRTFIFCSCKAWGCDGSEVQACSETGCSTICTAAGINCSCADCGSCPNISCCLPAFTSCVSCCDTPQVDSGCACLNSHGTTVDLRTAQMISDGCNPCITQFMNSPVVTVTDSRGNSISFSVEVSTDE